MQTIAITLGDLNKDGIRVINENCSSLGQALENMAYTFNIATVDDITNVEYL